MLPLKGVGLHRQEPGGVALRVLAMQQHWPGVSFSLGSCLGSPLTALPGQGPSSSLFSTLSRSSHLCPSCLSTFSEDHRLPLALPADPSSQELGSSGQSGWHLPHSLPAHLGPLTGHFFFSPHSPAA
jgi:hypothetical protein